MAWQKRNMFSSAVDMQRGGAVPWPGYFTGGKIRPTRSEIMPMQLFEEGDQDINMALNNLESTTNPSIEQIKKTEMPLVGDEMTMDQGPASFETDLMELKEEYTQEIMSFIGKPGAIEKLEPFLKTMQLSYEKDLDNIRKKYNVKEWSPEQDLFTPEFMAQVQQVFSGDIPGMVGGGVALPTTQEQLDKIFSAFPGKYTLAEFNMLSEEARQMLITRALIEKGTKAAAPTISPLDVIYKEGTDGQDPITVKQRLNQIIEERKNLARRSAQMPLTKQGGFAGFAEQMNAYRANQAAAESGALADELGVLEALSSGSKSALGTDVDMPADLINALTIGPDETKNDQTMFKIAQGQAEEVDDENPMLGLIYFKNLSPAGFYRLFPRFSGTKTIGDKEYTIDEYIKYTIETAGATEADQLAKDEIAALALGSWMTATETKVDPLNISGQP